MASRKRTISEEFVQVEKEEPSSTTTVNLTNKTTSEQPFGFKYVDQEKMNPLLLESSSFIKGVHLVEGLIDNPNLNVYYSHVAIPRLRSVNIFDKQKSLKYSDQIRTFLRELVHDLQFDTAYLPDAYSHFIGDYSSDSTSKDDCIQYDTATFNGIISLERSKRTTTASISKQVFFIFVKTLHELGHAAIFRSGRQILTLNLQGKVNHECFTTPATHALSGEAGNAIERFLFGSVIGTIGKSVGNSYIIKDVLFQEQKPSGVIHPSSLISFIDMDLENLEELPQFLYTSLSEKRLKSTRSSPKRVKTSINDDLIDENDDEDDDYDEDDDDDEEEDDDDNDEPRLASTN